jgi:hypothetical protein
MYLEKRIGTCIKTSNTYFSVLTVFVKCTLSVSGPWFRTCRSGELGDKLSVLEENILVNHRTGIKTNTARGVLLQAQNPLRKFANEEDFNSQENEGSRISQGHTVHANSLPKVRTELVPNLLEVNSTLCAAVNLTRWKYAENNA